MSIRKIVIKAFNGIEYKDRRKHPVRNVPKKVALGQSCTENSNQNP